MQAKNPVCQTWFFQLDFLKIKYRSTRGKSGLYARVRQPKKVKKLHNQKLSKMQKTRLRSPPQNCCATTYSPFRLWLEFQNIAQESKALRYLASRCLDHADTWFRIESKKIRDTLIFHNFRYYNLRFAILSITFWMCTTGTTCSTK